MNGGAFGETHDYLAIQPSPRGGPVRPTSVLLQAGGGHDREWSAIRRRCGTDVDVSVAGHVQDVL